MAPRAKEVYIQSLAAAVFGNLEEGAINSPALMERPYWWMSPKRIHSSLEIQGGTAVDDAFLWGELIL